MDVNCFSKTLQLCYLTRFWIHLWACNYCFLIKKGLFSQPGNITKFMYQPFLSMYLSPLHFKNTSICIYFSSFPQYFTLLQMSFTKTDTLNKRHWEKGNTQQNIVKFCLIFWSITSCYTNFLISEIHIGTS